MLVPMSYDRFNIFARILRGELPCDKVYEDDHVLAFRDINPKAPAHVLVIPKGPYINHGDFAARATEAEVMGFQRAVEKVTKMIGIANGGYRIISNTGANAHQEVPHYHIHILGGRTLGPLLAEKN